MRVWNIEQDQENGGRVAHASLPRFSARWMTGDDLEEIAALPGPACAGAIRGAGAARTPSMFTASSGPGVRRARPLLSA
jgi:hypothetical protein